MIKEAGLEDFFVKSCTVEADIKRNLDILDERFLCRCCVNSVRIEALIKNKSLENRFAVDKEFVSIKLYVTKTEIAVNSVIVEFKLKVIESAFAD